FCVMLPKRHRRFVLSPPFRALSLNRSWRLARRHNEADDFDRGSEDRRSVGSFERYLHPRRSCRPRSRQGRGFALEVVCPLLSDYWEERDQDNPSQAAFVA